MPLITHLNRQKFRVYVLKETIKNCKMKPIINEKKNLTVRKNSLNLEENRKAPDCDKHYRNEYICNSTNNNINVKEKLENREEHERKRSEQDRFSEQENEHGYINDIAKKLITRNRTFTRCFSSVTPNECTHGKDHRVGALKKYERILLIEKYTKYDHLKKEGYSDNYILKNFFRAYISHFTHTLIVNNISHLLQTKYKIHVSLLKAYKKNIDSIFISSGSVFSPDAIFSVGGDGTYLESAHIIANKYLIEKQSNETNKTIELVGINSDPRRSEGKLCLNFFSNNYSVEEQKEEIWKENREADNYPTDFEHKSFYDFEKIYHKKKKVNILFTDVSAFVQELIEKEKNITNNCVNNGEQQVIKEGAIKIDDESIQGIDYILKDNVLGYTAKKKISKEYTHINDTEKVESFHREQNKSPENKETKCSSHLEIQEEMGKGPNSNNDTINNIEPDKFQSFSSRDSNEMHQEMADIEELMKNTDTQKTHNIIISVQEYTRNILERFFETDKYKKLNRKYITVLIKRENKQIKMYKSINEVYIYEAIKNNICTYINIDNKMVKKLKSTALLITSGTGSTAWAYNVNKIDKKKMKNIISEFLKTQNDSIQQNIKNINYDVFSEYINDSICFHPDSKYMKCIIKEPVENSVYDSTDQIYTCNYISIKTCTSNTIIYIDGIYNIKIQPNDSVTLYINENDFIVTYK